MTCTAIHHHDAPPLKVSESNETYSYLSRLVDEAGGVEKLLSLQAHPNEAIYGKMI